VCGRFAQVFDELTLDRVERIVRAMCRDENGSLPPVSYNVAPTHNANVVLAADEPDRVMSRASFGFAKTWDPGAHDGDRLINARSETLLEKRIFEPLARTRRCVVPISGFYEWQSVVGERKKRPWYITRSDGDPMILAGVWDETPTDSGLERRFVIVTRAAEGLCADIHERAPMILDEREISAWLDPDDPDAPRDIIAAHTHPELQGVRVSHRVNSVVHNDPGLTEEDRSGEQGMLFG
jgi:putative SOS response-associated peptidase YedK